MTEPVEGPQAEREAGAAAADRWAEAQPYEPGADLVADLAAEREAEPETAVPQFVLEPEPAPEEAPDTAAPEPAPEPEPEPAPAPEPEPEPEPAPAPEPEPATSARDRKLAAVVVLLEAASGCADADMPRAAALYQEAILGCLDAAGDSDGVAGVDMELLRGFDGLSSLLERRGLSEEALGVVDDAASLGLLNGGPDVAGGHRDALKDRREGLRRMLFADSAQL